MKKFTFPIIFVLLFTMIVGVCAACKENEEMRTQYTVTFQANYDGSIASSVKVYENEVIAQPAEPIRVGYDFDGWYTDIACVNPYDFTSAVTEDITLYANWLESGITYYTVTYHANYIEGKDFKQKVKADSFAVAPDTPVRENYDFYGWFKQAECTDRFYFSSPITADVEVYALWNQFYVFEAENLDFDDLEGPGYSGSATGTNMILKDLNGTMGASGGYYVSYLYRRGLALEFHINSTEDVTDAHLYASLSSEQDGTKLTSSTYLFMVNDMTLAYSDIVFTDVPFALSDERKPFETYLISLTVSLKKGENTIVLMANNDDKMGGTMSATAPLVDCLKISSSAELSWGDGYPIQNK